ncbi:MAG: mycofactocin biosynthesis glycosyltransferase MftF [Pseudonocardia sp.]|nr:mycofactocin biosynthesis glycosyltransferase MftF [Pseudonocardia sp.]
MTPGVRLTGPSTTRLPVGFAIKLDRRTRRLDGGSALLGGSPGRLVRLAPAARRLLDQRGGSLVVRDATGAALARRLLDAGLANPLPDQLPGTPAPAGVTVVVPVRDRPVGLRRLLAALAATTAGLAQVIVVDDGSQNEVACRVVAKAAGARLLRHPRSLGPAAARNTGLAAATTPVVAFLDSDVVPTAGWLAPLLAHLADPAVALVAPRIVGLPTSKPGWLARYEGLRSALDLGSDPAPVLPRSRVAYVPSAALVVRRVGVGAGFDPSMPVAEDVDLGLRLREAGWRLRYEPSATVAHEHRDRFLDWWTRKAFYGTGAAPLALAHPGAVPPAVLAPWTAAACVLAVWQRPCGLVAAVLITAFAVGRLRRVLSGGSGSEDPRSGDPGLAAPMPLALRLAGTGLLGAAVQCASLLTRHWWPLTVLACLVSRRARRAALAAALAEGAWDWWTHRPPRGRLGLDPVRYVLAHRLDDLGYGAGLWWGAYRRRIVAPLLPMITWRKTSNVDMSRVR